MNKKLIFIYLIFSFLNLFGSINNTARHKKRKKGQAGLDLKIYNKAFIAIDEHKFDKASKKIKPLSESMFKQYAGECVIKTYEQSLLRGYEKIEKEIKRFGHICKADLHIYEEFLTFIEEISARKAISPYEHHIKKAQLPYCKKFFQDVIDYFYNK